MAVLLIVVLATNAQAKYVFYFIGDGMGSNQVLGAEMYRAALDGDSKNRIPTLMSTFPYSGQVTTYSKSNEITDSSAAGTCLATGTKTDNGVLGLDEHMEPLRTIAEELKEQGWGIGIMTSVAIDHATPGAFYGHVEKRNKYYKIGIQLAESGFDFFGGAGFHHPQGKNDDKDLNLYRNAEKAGYFIAHGYEEAQDFLNGKKGKADKMILVQRDDDQGAKHGDNIGYTIDRNKEALSLPQIVGTAIPFLEQNYKQFFMMVEGGMIDYACHGNDAATAFGEVWEMDEAMQIAYKFYQEHPDETLIVVTADHETGGMALGNSDYRMHLELLKNQRCSAWILSDIFTKLFKENKKPKWEQVKNIYTEQLGFWDNVEITADEEKELKAIYKAACKGKAKDHKTLYKSINKLGDAGIALLNKKAHVGWTTGAHSAHAVPVFAIGVGAERFTGWHDNTEIAPLIKKAISE